MVATPVADRRPFYASPEDGVVVKGECPRCHHIRHMHPEALCCSWCMTAEDLQGAEQREMEAMAKRVAEIKRRRTSLGLRQADVADKAGISRTTLTHMESGHIGRPQEDTLVWVEGALDYLEKHTPKPRDLKRRRKSLGIHRSTLAQHLGRSDGWVERLENGLVKRPTLERLLSVEEALDEIEETMPKVDDLKQRREELGVSLLDLSRDSGVGHNTIWQMETYPTRKPYLDTLTKIKEGLDEIEQRLGCVPKQPWISELKMKRRQLGLHISDIARESGIQVSTLKDIDRGVTKHPRLQTLLKLQRAIKRLSVTTPVKPDLAELIQKRKALGVTQYQLHKLTNLSRSHIASIESGAYANPSLETLLKIQSALFSLERSIDAKR